MIIVEGPDGAGKSHLIRRLSEDLGLEPEPRVVSKDAEAMTDLRLWVEKDLASWPRPALYDRHRLISEPIYAPILRPCPNSGFEDITWLTAQFEKFVTKSPMVVVCLPPINFVLDNVRGDSDNIVVAEHIDKIYWLYHMAAARDPRWLVWDYTHPDKDRRYQLLMQTARRKMHVVAGVKERR